MQTGLICCQENLILLFFFNALFDITNGCFVEEISGPIKKSLRIAIWDRDQIICLVNLYFFLTLLRYGFRLVVTNDLRLNIPLVHLLSVLCLFVSALSIRFLICGVARSDFVIAT